MFTFEDPNLAAIKQSMNRRAYAKALKEKSDLWSSMISPENSKSVHTNAHGAFPGQDQINWGGLIQNGVGMYNRNKSINEAQREESSIQGNDWEALQAILNSRQQPAEVMNNQQQVAPPVEQVDPSLNSSSARTPQNFQNQIQQNGAYENMPPYDETGVPTQKLNGGFTPEGGAINVDPNMNPADIDSIMSQLGVSPEQQPQQPQSTPYNPSMGAMSNRRYSDSEKTAISYYAKQLGIDLKDIGMFDGDSDTKNRTLDNLIADAAAIGDYDEVSRLQLIKQNDDAQKGYSYSGAKSYYTLKDSTGKLRVVEGIVNPIDGRVYTTQGGELIPEDAIPTASPNTALAHDAQNKGAKKTQELIAEARHKLPKVKLAAQYTLELLKKLKPNGKIHPGATSALGPLDSNIYSVLPDTIAFQALADQINSRAFLEAFETLKGGGQITVIEGEKATEALSRMQNRKLYSKDWYEAYDEFVFNVRQMVKINEEMASRPDPTTKNWEDE